MKYFIASDIHGHCSLFQKTLMEHGFDINNPNHKVILCGDAFDRGPENLETFKFLVELGDKLIYIKGNHETLLEECYTQYNYVYPRYDDMTLAAYNVEYYHVSNGTVDTMLTFLKAGVMNDVITFLKTKCVNYFELDDYVFVHGWIPKFNWKFANDFTWEEATWCNGMLEWSKGNRIDGKTIVCGHWHCGWGHVFLERDAAANEIESSTAPFIHKGIMAIDACTAATKHINVVVVEKEEANGETY